ncbi:MAG: hypothetical protein AAGK47_08730 [Bacteroidota bacterium]
MKTLIATCLVTCILVLHSCTPSPLPIRTDDLVGIWRASSFQMGTSDINSYVSLAFYDDQHFSLKINVPIGGDDVRAFKWGGDWEITTTGQLRLSYDGDSGFMGTFSNVEQTLEKFYFTQRINRLTMDSELRGVDFNLNLQRAD